MDFNLQLTDEELELLYQMSRFRDMDGGEYQSEEMEALGEKIRTAVEELE